MVAAKPGPPVLSVYADESSKTKHRCLVVGSVWSTDVGRLWRVALALQDWKREQGITWDFKLSELSKGKLEHAKAFVRKAMELSDLIRLKICVLDTEAAPDLRGEERLYRLYYELLLAGIEHEVTSGRVLSDVGGLRLRQG